tara:strand:- start:511 stop:1149 length:639 start_codon:yes stop_codon:yes gene_type:complete
MQLTERVFNNQFLLLFAVLIPVLIVAYCVRNRPLLVKNIAIANLKKTNFRFVSNNIQDQIVKVLFWSSLALQTTFIAGFFNERKEFSIWLIVAFVCIVLGKRILLFLSDKVFQTPNLLNTYYTSFMVMVIHLGWLTAPILLIKFTYLSFISTEQTYVINLGLGAIVLTYLFYRFIMLLLEAFKENISFLHIIFYLCTLEILPVVLILNFLIS